MSEPSARQRCLDTLEEIMRQLAQLERELMYCEIGERGGVVPGDEAAATHRRLQERRDETLRRVPRALDELLAGKPSQDAAAREEACADLIREVLSVWRREELMLHAADIRRRWGDTEIASVEAARARRRREDAWDRIRPALRALVAEERAEAERLRARVAEVEAALRGVGGIRRCQRCGGEGRVEPPESSLLTQSAECPVCHGRGLVREWSEG